MSPPCKTPIDWFVPPEAFWLKAAAQPPADLLSVRKQARPAAFRLLQRIIGASRPPFPHACQSAIAALAEILEA